MLTGRIALVTGSTGGGMGRSIALTLAQNGADIVLNYGTFHRADDAEAERNGEAVKAAIEALGRRALLVKADTRSHDAVAAMVRETVAAFGKIDILVNNAGSGWDPLDFAAIPPEQFRGVIEAEIDGVFHCIRECLPVMRQNQWGRIITLGAQEAGYWAAEHFGPVEYAIGKGGRALLTRHLALKERQHNITVNLINPGPGHTPAFESVEQALAFAAHGDDWQARAKATPQDIAEAVLFLCSEGARFITGSPINFAID